MKIFNEDCTVLWKAEAPKCVLKKLGNCQLAETLQVWYEYRTAMLSRMDLSSYHMQDYIWWNKNISLKHKPYFYYPVWKEKGIFTISHLYRGFNTVKTFEDLVLEYDIPIKDRRKYDSLMNGIYLDWFIDPQDVAEDLFQKYVLELIKTGNATCLWHFTF